MRFSHARWPQQHDVFVTLYEAQGSQRLDLLLRSAGGEGEVVILERLYRRKAAIRVYIACLR